MRTRLLLGLVGVLAAAFGVLRFLQLDLPDVVDAGIWLVGGVLVHDVVLAPLTVAVTVLLSRVLPSGVRTRVMVAFVVLATVTVTTASAAGALEIAGLDKDVARRLVDELTVKADAVEGDAT